MTRKPLGRGLEALIEGARPQPSSSATGAVLNVAVERIAPLPFQPRTKFDSERLAELARSIQSQGLIEPLVVRPALDGSDSYQLIAGERRLRAARQAGLSVVPVLVKQLDDRSALEMSLVENLAREDLGPIDEARALLRLSREFGLSQEEIARRIGKSRPYVSNAIRLLDLPAAVVEMIERDELTAGQARPLLALDGEQAQLEAARQIVMGGVSARGAEEMARTMRPSRVSRRRRTLEPDLQALKDSLQEALKRRVQIIPGKRGGVGRIEIEYYDNSDLTSLVDSIIAIKQWFKN
jgi:ParB family chromosome partitioning protein